MAEQHRGGWSRRDGRPGRLGVLFAGIWLLFLLQPLGEGWARRGTIAGWVGIVCVLAFVVVYLGAFAATRQRRLRGGPGQAPARMAVVLAAMTVLGLVMCLTVGQSGTACAVYVAVASVMWLPGPVALAVVTLVAVVSDLSARVVPGWTEDGSLTFAICAAAFAMWGVNQLMLRNFDLMQARDENARLAVSAERNRFARDLHDILGHS